MRKVTGIELSIMDIAPAHNDGMQWAALDCETKMYLLCTEGVAYEVGSWSDDKCVDSFGLTKSEIRAEIANAYYGMTTPEEFIRSFGSRLESNFHAFVAEVKFNCMWHVAPAPVAHENIILSVN